jgi:hypothetical protein
LYELTGKLSMNIVTFGTVSGRRGVSYLFNRSIAALREDSQRPGDPGGTQVAAIQIAA